MKKVVIYARSSQDKHDVSCDAQVEQLTKIVRENEEELVRIFQDKALSSTRDIRPAFDEMIALATGRNEKPFSKIYCLDTSRFGRDHYESQVLLYQLREKHGVEIRFLNIPDTGGFIDKVMETIMSAFDYLHSQQSKVKGVASMKQNIRLGFRAGGRAPYGYKNDHIKTGTHRKGDEIFKTKLIPDPETAPIAAEYFERRAKGETRMAILQDFFNRGIPSPTGRMAWSNTTGKAMEENLAVYLGHTVFNKLNERIKVRGKFQGYKGGIKYRGQDEWVVTENTHPPLISENVANSIRRLKEKRRRETPINAKRIYPLSGCLKCAVCGTAYIGDRVIYRCNSTTHAGQHCDNQGISGKLAEDAIFSFIQGKLLSLPDIHEMILQVRRRFAQGDSEIAPLETRLKELDRDIDRMIDLYQSGIIDKEILSGRIEPAREQRQAVATTIRDWKAKEQVVEVTEEVIRAAIDNLREEVNNADPHVRKRVIQALFDDILVYPKEEDGSRFLEARGIILPLTRVRMASPTGFEPVLPA